MFSKGTQPTIVNKLLNNSPHGIKFRKCGDSENSFSFKSYGLF